MSEGTYCKHMSADIDHLVPSGSRQLQALTNLHFLGVQCALCMVQFYSEWTKFQLMRALYDKLRQYRGLLLATSWNCALFLCPCTANQYNNLQYNSVQLVSTRMYSTKFYK